MNFQKDQQLNYLNHLYDVISRKGHHDFCYVGCNEDLLLHILRLSHHIDGCECRALSLD
jgi:hypothetical protein